MLNPFSQSISATPVCSPAHQGRPALGRPLCEMVRSEEADARGMRNRLGSHYALLGGVAAPGWHVRVGRDVRLSW